MKRGIKAKGRKAIKVGREAPFPLLYFLPFFLPFFNLRPQASFPISCRSNAKRNTIGIKHQTGRGAPRKANAAPSSLKSRRGKQLLPVLPPVWSLYRPPCAPLHGGARVRPFGAAFAPLPPPLAGRFLWPKRPTTEGAEGEQLNSPLMPFYGANKSHFVGLYQSSGQAKNRGCWICDCTPAKRAHNPTPARGFAPRTPGKAKTPRQIHRIFFGQRSDKLIPGGRALAPASALLYYGASAEG